MALKDINGPSVNTALKHPLGSLKRWVSEPGWQSSLQCKSRFGKDNLEKYVDCGFTGSSSEQKRMNICTDLTNTPLTLQDERSLCKTEVSVLSVLKNNDGIVAPVLSKEHLPGEIQFSSPGCHPVSKALGVSNMSLSYFADPTVPCESEEQESAEVSSIDSDKYFSTPMPSKGVKKKLTPVMEVDFESNMSEEWQHRDNVNRIDMFHKNAYCADVSSHETPAKTPLYRSFFAAECQEIVNQIRNIGTDVKSPGKRKVEEFDLSMIDAEPPPYECTPMKSMLACEVSKMMCSLESSPFIEGRSLFGVSLLDLEKTEQLNDCNLSECGIKNNKGHSVSNAEGLSHFSDRLEGVSIKRQKTKPLEMDWGLDHLSQVNAIITLPKVLDRLTPETSASESLHTCAASKCCDEGITAVLSSNALQAEHKLSDRVTEPPMFMPDMAVALNISRVIKTSPRAPVSTNTSLASMHEGNITGCLRRSRETDVRKLCASTPQDIVTNYDDPTNATHVIDVNMASTNTRQSVTSIHEEMTTANATHVAPFQSPISNTTQDIPSIQEAYIANTTHLVDMAELHSGSTTQDIASVNEDAMSVNTTQTMDAVPQSANTTQDVTPMHDVVASANTTQLIETEPLFPANTTQDIPSMHECKPANTTHEIEVVQQTCVNTTQDVASVHEAVTTPNTTQVIEIVPQASADRSQDNTSTLDDISTTPCTQDVGIMPKCLAEVLSSIPDRLFKPVTQASLHAVLDVPAQHGVVVSDLNLPGTTGTNQSVSNFCYDLNGEAKKDLGMINIHTPFSNLDPTQETLEGAEAKEFPFVELEDKTSVDLTRATIDPSTLVGPLAPAKLNVTEGHKLEGNEHRNCISEMATSKKEVDVCKELRNPPLLSESCSMIQDEENAHDASVFSIGSLSFVTSTPVPGLNNFQFLKSCKDSVPHGPNTSIGPVLDESANEVPGEQAMNHHDKGKPPSRVSFLPLSIQRSTVPPPQAMPKPIPSTSGIPSARRSLALYQNLAKEPAVSKVAPMGIPGRSLIRPPLNRQSLPRAFQGNPNQGMKGTGGSITQLTGNRFRPPNATAVVKTKSQLPMAPSVKPPSRLVAPAANVRLSIGGQNAAASLPDTPISGTVSGIRTGLQRTGTPSLHHPLPQSQKVFQKCKSHIKGLPTKKLQREHPTFAPQREIGSIKAGSIFIRSAAKLEALAPNFTKEPAPVPASIKPSSSPNHTVQAKAEKFEYLLSSEDGASIPAASTELAESRCEHLETCKCCYGRYCQLLQELEDLKRCLGQVEMTHTKM
ncbi:uncharacterized protein LOC142659495 [Rhinoderma darwinii]|uniref:uncharacterized protein LOC142659495 n=1 Tax=Rhinoderma darwinii TaxID=43563 RepID=UPI003F680E9F